MLFVNSLRVMQELPGSYTTSTLTQDISNSIHKLTKTNPIGKEKADKAAKNSTNQTMLNLSIIVSDLTATIKPKLKAK